MKSTGFGIYVEKIASQDTDETIAWNALKDTTLLVKCNKVQLTSDTTKDKLVSTTEINTNDKLLLVDSNNNTKSFKAVNVIKNGSNNDIFNDGSCVAFYKFDNDVNDAFNTYNGTIDGNVNYVNGKFNKAIKIDEETKIQVPDIVLEGDFSVSFWINIYEDNGRVYVVHNGSGDVDLQSIAVNLNGNCRIDTSHTAGDNNFNVPALSTNTFYHFVIGRKNNAGFAYFNNTLIKDNISSYVTSDDFVIKAIQRKHGSSILDQLRIFNKALTSDEVNTLYNETGDSVTAGYSVNISSLNLDTPPTYAFICKEPKVGLQLEYDINKIINNITEKECTIDASSTKDLLVLNDKVLVGETIFIDGTEFKIASVDYNGNKSNIDISSLNLSNVPTHVYSTGYIPLVINNISDNGIILSNTTSNYPLDQNDVLISNKGLLKVSTSKKVDADTIAQLQGKDPACDFLGDGSNIATYSLDNSINDMCNKYPGTWHGSSQYEDGAAKFDGNSYIKLTDLGAESGIKDGEFTFSCWYKLTNPDKLSQRALVSIGDTSGKNVLILTSDAVLHYATKNSDVYNDTLSLEWKHITLVQSNGISNVYINGVKQISWESGVSFSEGQQILLGGDANDDQTPNGYCMQGLIKDVMFFNRPLSETEVSNTYKNLKDPSTYVYTGKQICDFFGDGSAVASYQLNGNTNDTCGNYNGSWSGDSAYTNSEIGTCAVMNAHHIDIGPISLSDFTFSCWLKFTSTEDGAVFIAANNKGGSSLTSLILFEDLVNNKIGFDINGDSTNAGVTIGKHIGTDKFHHFVWTRKGTTGNIYIDGVNVSGNLTIKSDIFDFYQLCRENFTGLLGKVKLFNRALTQNEVQQLYGYMMNPYGNNYADNTKVSAEVTFTSLEEKHFTDDGYDYMVGNGNLSIYTYSSNYDLEFILGSFSTVDPNTNTNEYNEDYVSITIDGKQIILEVPSTVEDKNEYNIQVNNTGLKVELQQIQFYAEKHLVGQGSNSNGGTAIYKVKIYNIKTKQVNVSFHTNQTYTDEVIGYREGSAYVYLHDISNNNMAQITYSTLVANSSNSTDNVDITSSDTIAIPQKYSTLQATTIEPVDISNGIFKYTYSTLFKQGKHIQRRIIMPKEDTEVLEPFITKLGK